MLGKNIFIASPSQSVELAKLIADSLKDAGLTPRPWWEEFPAGTTTFERLLELTRSVDGAVLILSAVEKSRARDTERPTPADNLVLECGMFLEKLGPKRAVIITEPDTSLPSDIRGLTFLSLGKEERTLAQEVVKHFTTLFSEKSDQYFSTLQNVIADPKLNSDLLRDHLPGDWHSRTMYVGRKGAMNWLEVVNDPHYISLELWHRLYNKILTMLRNVNLQTVISLGPGDAKMDEALISHLVNKDPWLRYIPIDLNEYLLVRSADKIGKHAEIPIALLTDFEAYLPVVRPLLDIHRRSPSLFSILGYTFGNLDGLERCFLDRLKAVMRKGDYFLMDFLILPKEWNPDEYHAEAYSEYTESLRRWLCHSVTMRTGESTDNLLRDFEKRFIFRRGHSDIEEAHGTAIVDSLRNDDLVSHMRRYPIDSFREWLIREVGFEIVDIDEVKSNQKYGGTGIVLARYAR